MLLAELTLSEVLLSLITLILGVVATVAIPFTFKIHGRLTKIETEVAGALDMAERVKRVEEQVLELRLRAED